MSRFVPDASVAVKWYVPEVHADAAARLLDRAHELHAPDLILPEFGNILWKKVRRGEVSANQGREILRAFLAVPMMKHPGTPLLEPAFETASGTGQAVYDCTYLALSLALRCRMVTADEKFYRALRPGPLGSSLVWVEDLLDQKA